MGSVERVERLTFERHRLSHILSRRSWQKPCRLSLRWRGYGGFHNETQLVLAINKRLKHRSFIKYISYHNVLRHTFPDEI